MATEGKNSNTLHQLHQQLQETEQAIATAEAELAHLKADMAEFEAQFEARIGAALTQLTELEAEVNGYLQRIKQMRLEKRFGQGYQAVEDQFAEKWHKPRPSSPVVPPAPPPLTAVRLKKLYRQLARRYHPDLALNEADRAQRTAVMTAVITAYQAGDLAALLLLANPAQPPVASDQPIAAATAPSLWHELVNTLEAKKAQLQQLQTAVHMFHHQPLVELALESRLAARDGRDLLAEMAQTIQQKIGRKQAERDMLQAQFAHLQ